MRLFHNSQPEKSNALFSSAEEDLSRFLAAKRGGRVVVVFGRVSEVDG